MKCKIVVPNGDSLSYEVPVVKYWNIDPSKIKDELYALIPFQVFTARKEIEDIITDKTLDEEQRRQQVYAKLQSVKQTIEISGAVINEKQAAGKINYDDAEKMSSVIVYFNDHLYNRYTTYYAGFQEEVVGVVKKLIFDPAMATKAKINERVEDILETLQSKGEVPEGLENYIRSQTDIKVLRKLNAQAYSVKNVAEFEQYITILGKDG